MKIKVTKFRVILLLLILGSIGGFVSLFLMATSINREEEKEEMGVFIPVDSTFVFTDAHLFDGSGKKVELGDYRGKVLLVNLWATWCPPCIEELPSLAKLQQKLGGKDFAVLPVAVYEEDPAKVEGFLRARNIKLPAIIDLEDSFDKVFRLSKIPMTFLVDRNGLARMKLLGDAEWDCKTAYEEVARFIATEAVDRVVIEPCS